MKYRKLTTVYGGQFGSEGKGQIASFLFEQAIIRGYLEAPPNPNEQWDVQRVLKGTTLAVRIGGPNAGHTFYHPIAGKIVVQSLPIGVFYGADGVIGAAGLIILDLLASECANAANVLQRKPLLFIDPCAVLIDQAHMVQETELKSRIGSTGEGVGAATAQKVMRNPDITVKANMQLVMDALLPYATVVVTSTPALLNAEYQDDLWVMIEGTQGAGLSLHTSGFYPFCTSRECTPAGLYGEIGINSRLFTEERIMVVRTYPIRVGGNSGPLPNEISWDELKEKSGGYVQTPEITTVTKKQRRIAEIDLPFINRIVRQTGPDCLALTFLDYVFPELEGMIRPDNITMRAQQYLKELDLAAGAAIGYVSTGPGATFSISTADYFIPGIARSF